MTDAPHDPSSKEPQDRCPQCLGKYNKNSQNSATLVQTWSTFNSHARLERRSVSGRLSMTALYVSEQRGGPKR